MERLRDLAQRVDRARGDVIDGIAEPLGVHQLDEAARRVLYVGELVPVVPARRGPVPGACDDAVHRLADPGHASLPGPEHPGYPCDNEIERKDVSKRQDAELGCRLGRAVDADRRWRARLGDRVAVDLQASEDRAGAHVDESSKPAGGRELRAQTPGRHGVDVEDLERAGERRCALPERAGHLGVTEQGRGVNDIGPLPCSLDEVVQGLLTSEVS